MFDAADLFEQNGHEILYFAMADDRNIPCAQHPHFPANLDYTTGSLTQKIRRAKTILERTLYSREVAAKLTALIEESRPDIAHIHSIYHHLSPSVISALNAADIPVVQTVHDFKLICPNYRLYIPQERDICTRCVSGSYSHCIRHRCLKESTAANTLVAAELWLHKRKRYYEDGVQRFICSTEFLMSQLAEGNIPREKLLHIPHHIALEAYQPSPERTDAFVFVGRLEPEKGCLTLIRAMAKLPDSRCLFVGNGSQRAECEALIRELGLTNVELMGFQSRETVSEVVSQSRALIIPSEWYEPCGLTTWEAHALERPVIGSRIGGIPESIEDGTTGLLFEPGNDQDLADKLRWIRDHPDEAETMGREGRKRVTTVCNAHYGHLLSLYESVIDAYSVD